MGTLLKLTVMLGLLLLLLGAWSAQAGQTVLSHHTLTTPLGKLKGSKVRINQHNNKIVYQFLAVPYAKPPVGHLRFAKPEAVQAWSGVRDATSYGPSCQQTTSATTLAALPNNKLSEDCLHLNIYVPHGLPAHSGVHSNHSRPVMVWLHGGGYVTRQASLSDGSLLALHGNVIVVSVDYRLDVFGFLFTRNNKVASPGNQGLWDQLQALRWVQSNIASFGGDPARVTLFGRSAGAYSTGLLALSPLANGLIQRIILQSDVAIGPRALFYGPDDYNQGMARLLGCADPGRRPRTFVACLRRASAHDLLNASSSIMNEHKLSYAMPMGPVVDGELLPASPRLMMEGGGGAPGGSSAPKVGPPVGRDVIAGFNDGEGGIFVSDLRDFQDDFSFNMSQVPYRSVEVMAGFNNAEGGLFISRLRKFQNDFNFQMKQGVPTRVVCDHIAPLLAAQYFMDSSAVSSAICRRYTRATSATAYTQGRALTDLFSDFVWFAPIVQSLLIHHSLQSGLPSPRKAFLYQFSHQPADSAMPSRVPWFHRASHGEELDFVFGPHPHNPARRLTAPGETTLSSTIMTYWTNFAKYGDPNGPAGSKVTWPQFEPIRRPYVNLDLNGTSVHYNPYRKAVDFWLNTLPSLVPHPAGTSVFG